MPCPPCQPSAAAAIKLQEARRISRSRPPPLIAHIGFPLSRCYSLLCCSLFVAIELQEFPADDDGMKLEAVAASKSGGSSSSTVAFSWEQEPGVSKQRHSDSEAKKPTAGGGPRAEAVSRRTPASAKKQAPAAAATAHQHRLRVPPPPGGPGAPAASPPPGRRKPRSSRGVRPADDPFLAAYLACTGDSANGGKRVLGWAGLGLGLGLGMRGLGLSCKSSCEAVEECVVRLAKIPGLEDD